MVLMVAGAVFAGGAGQAGAEAGDDGRLYGVLVMGAADSSYVVTATNYPSWDAAEEAARELCERPTCVVVARFVDECVSLGMTELDRNGRSGDYRIRMAPTAQEAEAAAVAAAGKLGPGRVHAKTVCTANAG
ncbi:DUF4189 domain-containing protein [Nocardia sp. NPDC058640]|uniref:DUF4189 domain-containing protein n=1 Tax=Nocardia sp. NPDC058640 TaxID=3346571 RepID=UPI003668C5A4